MTAESVVGSAQRTVRRLITYLLLFALVVIAAVGLSGLLGRLLAGGTELATGDVAGLARSLAFALIGGPLAALLWWGVWRRLDDETERASIGWGLYVAGMYVLALVLATSNLLSTVATLIGGQSLQWRLSLATGAGLGRRLGLAPLDVAASPQAAAGPAGRPHGAGQLHRAGDRGQRGRHRPVDPAGRRPAGGAGRRDGGQALVGVRAAVPRLGCGRRAGLVVALEARRRPAAARRSRQRRPHRRRGPRRRRADPWRCGRYLVRPAAARLRPH